MLKLKCVCTVIYVLKEVCMYVCLMRSSVEVEVCMYSYICTKGSVYVCMFDEIEC